MPTTRLLVKEAFGSYAPGDRIENADEIARVTASHPDFVLREPSPPKAEEKPAAAPPLGAPAAAAKPAAPTTTVDLKG